MWKTDDLVHSRTIDLGEAWVTDCVWLPFHERLAVSSSDHAVRCPGAPAAQELTVPALRPVLTRL